MRHRWTRISFTVLLVLLPLAVVAFDSLVDIIPFRLEGKTRGKSVHVAEIKAGTPRTTFPTGLDFSGSSIATITAQTDDISTTFTPGGGGSDLVWISGHRLRLPFTTDPLRVEKLCPRCEALIGVGPSSPLWVVWKEATFGSGAVSLGDLADIIKDADTFGRLEDSTQLDNHIKCTIGFTGGLCKTPALVGPNGVLVDVVFSFEERKTLVPQSVFLDYTAGKNVHTTEEEDWDDLVLVFIDLTADSADTSVSTRIRRHDLVSETEIGPNQLNLGVTPLNASVVFLGNTVWRSFFVHVHWIPHTVQVINWKVEKSYEGYIGFVLISIGLCLVWWKGTQSGMWTVHWKQRPRRIVALMFFTAVSLVTIWVQSTRCAIREFLLVDIYFQVFIYAFLVLAWFATGLHLFMRYGYGPQTTWYYNIFGLTYAEEQFVLQHTAQQRKHGISVVPSGTSIRIHQSERLRNVSRVSTHRGTLPWTTFVWYNANIGSQRVWAIITFCVDMVLFSTLILAWSTTREDTLTGIGSLLLFSFLIVIMTYHLISHFYHRSGHHAVAWYAFLVLALVHLVLTVLVAEVYIYYPFIHRFVPDYSDTPSIISFLFTLGLFYFAENIAKSRVNYRAIFYTPQHLEAKRI